MTTQTLCVLDGPNNSVCNRINGYRTCKPQAPGSPNGVAQNAQHEIQKHKKTVTGFEPGSCSKKVKGPGLTDWAKWRSERFAFWKTRTVRFAIERIEPVGPVQWKRLQVLNR
jgi:hypothetical protein